MKCSLCGYEFDISESSSACSSCPMNKSCTLLRCPNCGYEFPKEPEWLEKLTKLFKGKKNGRINS
ncbi:MAG: hypothetical protein JXB50_00610 [Spirochaetes bacterium]|nr:hypothetical protein [Spirochaetota bacterium]